MRISSPKGTRTRSATVMLGMTVTILLAASMLTIQNASADGPIATMDVKGYIYDEFLDVVADADVTVTTKDGETVMATYGTVSGAEGYYQVTFGSSEYDFGCTIEVTATDGVLEKENTTVAAVSALWNWVNVTLSIEIPEFGGAYGLSMVFAVSGVMAVFVVMGRRRR
ncbi:MAG: hypothetical protein MUO94_05405 [Thermoplasmata archaeon]|nr:hypothetical protein [Thermoplasmata archaeon]